MGRQHLPCKTILLVSVVGIPPSTITNNLLLSLLHQENSDDEASTRLLQVLLFLLFVHIFSRVYSLCLLGLLFTFSIHLLPIFLCILPPPPTRTASQSLALHPCFVSEPCEPSFPGFVYKFDLYSPSSFMVASFRILSLLHLPNILRSQFNSGVA